MLVRIFVFIITFVVLTGCSSRGVISLTSYDAWFEGDKVQYVVTDVSDKDIAELFKANYAPRLRDAIPKYPKPPEVKTALERVYVFIDNSQENSVFPSIPQPLGPLSQDQSYSPLWLMYAVEWDVPSFAKTLTSEEAILKAEEAGLLRVTRTDIVINCPVVGVYGSVFLQ